MLSKIRQLGIEVLLDNRDQIDKYREWAKILRALDKKGIIRFDSKYIRGLPVISRNSKFGDRLDMKLLDTTTIFCMLNHYKLCTGVKAIKYYLAKFAVIQLIKCGKYVKRLPMQ